MNRSYSLFQLRCVESVKAGSAEGNTSGYKSLNVESSFANWSQSIQISPVPALEGSWKCDHAWPDGASCHRIIADSHQVAGSRIIYHRCILIPHVLAKRLVQGCFFQVLIVILIDQLALTIGWLPDNGLLAVGQLLVIRAGYFNRVSITVIILNVFELIVFPDNIF